jgi:hypothetical protein
LREGELLHLRQLRPPALLGPGYGAGRQSSAARAHPRQAAPRIPNRSSQAGACIVQRICVDMDEVMADTLAEHLRRYNQTFDEEVTPRIWPAKGSGRLRRSTASSSFAPSSTPKTFLRTWP